MTIGHGRGSLMVHLPPGAFWMGSRAGEPDSGAEERPRHCVVLDGYCMDRTEATVEAYRAGASTGFSAWLLMYDADDGWGATAPVGSFPAGDSPFGLHDTAGIAWEWTADWYGSYRSAASPSRNLTGPSTGSTRVVRGGSWDLGRIFAFSVRAASRNDSPELLIPWRCGV